jgi:ubiquinone biosynthesis protein
VEGVARSLDPEINFWEVARPVIEDWARDNLGPPARLREMAETLNDTLRRLPAILDGLERLAAAPATAATATATATGKIQKPAPGRAAAWALWAIALGLIAVAAALH